MDTAISTAAELRRDAREPGLLGLAERGWLPDAAIRLGIRRLCAQRLRECLAGGAAAQQARHQRMLGALGRMPLALHTEAANAQHYEVPAAFFEHCLGPQLKYSACLFEQPQASLVEAEEAMLALYAVRAGLEDGMDILELGCGWGSLTLWMAQRYPRARSTAVLRPEKDRSQPGRSSSGRGKAKRFASPFAASTSTGGPPGCGRARSFATLSKASPGASSMVPPRRRTLFLTNASPKPSPERSCFPERRNSSKIRSWSRGAMPRPLSATEQEPSICRRTVILVQKPAMASSMELSTTS